MELENSPDRPRRQAPGTFTAADLQRMDFGEEPSPAVEPRPIDDAELLRLLDEAGFDMVWGKGPFLSVARKGYTSIYRFFEVEAARKAYLWAYRWFGSAEFLVAVGDLAQRRHEGCDRWSLPAWRDAGLRRPKAWGGRYDPKRRAAYFARKFGDEPDIDRARRSILRQCEQCADCAREAGPEHLAKLREAVVKEKRVPLRELLEAPLDAL